MDRLDAHLGSRLTNMSADLLDVFGRGSVHLTTSISNPSLVYPPFSSASERALEQNLKDLGFPSSNPSGGEASSNPNVRFIYYNGTNKAMKNTLLFSGAGKTGTNYIPTWSAISLPAMDNQGQDGDVAALREELHIITDMRNHFDKIATRW